jgi:hypothetical protein
MGIATPRQVGARNDTPPVIARSEIPCLRFGTGSAIPEILRFAQNDKRERARTGSTFLSLTSAILRIILS